MSVPIRSCTIAKLLASILILLSAIPAGAQIRLDLPAQPLGQSLTALASIGNLTVIFDERDVDGLKAPALKANLTADEALDRLLAGTSLHAMRVDPSTIRVTRSTPGALSIDTMSKATGEDPRSQDERAWSSSPGRFRLAQVNPGEGAIDSRVGGPQNNSTLQNEKTQPARLDEVVITGTQIRGALTPSPLVQLDRSQIEATGYSTLEQVTQTLPQVFGGGVQRGTGFDLGTESSNNIARGAGVNLHGLGSGATLVLLNGHRLPAAGPVGVPDVSLIPLEAIDRIDVLTDGASATYGSDAVAGVVNIILRSNFDGVSGHMRYGASTQHGYHETEAGVVGGKTWATGNALIGYDYLDQSPLLSSARAFSSAVTNPTDLLGHDTSNRIFSTASWHPVDRLSFNSEAYWSRRNDDTVYTIFGPTSRDTPRNAQYGANLGVTYGIIGDWVVDAYLGRGSNEVNDHVMVEGSNGNNPRDFLQNQTFFEAKVEGAIGHIRGDPVRSALGIAYRRETYEQTFQEQPQLNASADRNVRAAFAEVIVPIIGPRQQSDGADRLDLTVAGRYEHYSDFGSTTNPKVGLSWTLTDGYRLRATFGRSFRAPTFNEIRAQYELDALLSLPDPAAPSGSSLVLYRAFGANPALQPETARTWTAGIDMSPASIEGLVATATYFNISYKNRIEQAIGAFSTALAEPAFDPLVNRSPDPALVAALTSRPFTGSSGFLNLHGPFNVPDVGVVVDNRYQNIAESWVSGVDASVSYKLPIDRGSLHSTTSATYILKYENSVGQNARAESLVNTVGFPLRLKIREAAGLVDRSWSADLAINYQTHYQDITVSPAAPVASWTTADARVQYELQEPWRRKGKLRIALSVQNVLDRRPPFVHGVTTFTAPIGYDPSNASPLGRFVALDATQSW